MKTTLLVTLVLLAGISCNDKKLFSFGSTATSVDTITVEITTGEEIDESREPRLFVAKENPLKVEKDETNTHLQTKHQ